MNVAKNDSPKGVVIIYRHGGYIFSEGLKKKDDLPYWMKKKMTTPPTEWRKKWRPPARSAKNLTVFHLDGRKLEIFYLEFPVST